MTPDEIKAFLGDTKKRLPASPAWRDHQSRVGEMKARMPIEAGGSISRVEMEMTIKPANPDYLVAVLIAPLCIARLCIGPDAEHRNRITGVTSTGPHFHDWRMNAHLPKREASALPYCVDLPGAIVGRDAAFSWFLREVGIESPDWLPVKWPAQGGLL